MGRDVIFPSLVCLPNLVCGLKRIAGAGLVMLSVAITPATAQNSDLYGLVVGIDDYIGTVNDLEGAVNDAMDISKALKQAGAKATIRLIDKQASKIAIKTSWDSLVQRANPGDTIVFTYSGHGSQEPEPEGRNGEEDKLNENFLLSQYQPSGVATKERIIDDEIFEWFKVADTKGVKVIFVADACHSGTMNRSIGPQKVRYRQGKFPVISDDLLDFPPPEFAHAKPDDLQHVTFIGATSDDKLTPEVRIEGKWRGALSWSFARALEGHADKDGNGEVSQFELISFLVPSVHSWVESQQTPQVRPIRATATALFKVKISKAKELQIASADTGRLRSMQSEPLRIATLPAGGASKLGSVAGIEIVADTAEADIIWDVEKGTIEHRLGGRMADNVTQASIAPVIGKLAALKWLKANAAFNPADVSLPNGNNRYKPGDTIDVRIGGARYPYLTLFNIAPNGRIEFFVPLPNRPNEARQDWRGLERRERFAVKRPPFGSENLVAIFTEEIATDLHAVLNAMTNVSDTVALRQALTEMLGNKPFQVGVLDIYTGVTQ